MVFLRKIFFRFVTRRMKNEESNLRPSDSASHINSTVSEVYTKFMIRVLHTARLSNVESVMFVDNNKRDGKF